MYVSKNDSSSEKGRTSPLLVMVENARDSPIAPVECGDPTRRDCRRRSINPSVQGKDSIPEEESGVVEGGAFPIGNREVGRLIAVMNRRCSTVCIFISSHPLKVYIFISSRPLAVHIITSSLALRVRIVTSSPPLPWPNKQIL